LLLRTLLGRWGLRLGACLLFAAAHLFQHLAAFRAQQIFGAYASQRIATSTRGRGRVVLWRHVPWLRHGHVHDRRDVALRRSGINRWPTARTHAVQRSGLTLETAASLGNARRAFAPHNNRFSCTGTAKADWLTPLAGLAQGWPLAGSRLLAGLCLVHAGLAGLFATNGTEQLPVALRARGRSAHAVEAGVH